MSTLYLVGVDGSEWSKRAAEKAIHLAQDTDAKVVFMHVIDWSDYRFLSAEEVLNRSIDRAEEERHATEVVLKPLITEHAGSGVRIDTDYTWGDPRDCLHQKAKELHATMIFMGRRGRSSVADLLLGSVSNAIAHHAGVPVVLVP